jgi:chromosome segregation protein
MLLADSADYGHLGSVADYLEVDKRCERAVEAVLGDRLQFVVVATHDDAASGLRIALDRNAGRVGFVVASEAPGPHFSGAVVPHSLTALAASVRVSGPASDAIAGLLRGVWLAPDADTARDAARSMHATVVTVDGDVFHGASVIEGGVRTESRGILATKREIKELREKSDGQGAAVDRLREEIAGLDVVIAAAESAIASLHGELHRQEKAIVGFELQLRGATDTADRVRRKEEQIGVERRSAEEEQRAQQARQDEARESILRIEVEQKAADENLNLAQRRLFDAREALQAQGQRAAEARASHAALVERAGALAAEVARLEQAGVELEARLQGRSEELRRNETRRVGLEQGIASAEERLNGGLRTFDELRDKVREADDRSQELRARFDEQDGSIRDARRAVETVRGEVAQLDVARATAEADLAHLSTSCVENVQATLDEVAAEVEQLERDGALASPRAVDDAPDAAEVEDDAMPAVATAAAGEAGEETEAVAQPQSRTLTPDEMVTDLRAKIERMGAVNMMAIDQFDDLESRHTFLTAQRKDLVDSIAATGEAIRRIDKTTKERFREAFAVINQNFEGTFTTLFGGGRAGLVLLDESDQLESGIDIIAQPPGKRLQSVQLLSGGEKALTAMALMFAIFKYRPSPFCLLDEIDAPLDDANIGRFVEMLQGMQDHTQFILITHNRKTMEIADRLYGVTMEEPGVSKLISVQLN